MILVQFLVPSGGSGKGRVQEGMFKVSFPTNKQEFITIWFFEQR
jgi:hypothetical protein